MKPFVTGLVHVTGEPDTGKTMFALTSGVPLKETAFFDHDVKGSVLVNSLPDKEKSFARYINITQFRKGKSEVDFVGAMLKEVEALPKGLGAFVWDNFTPFEDGIHPYILQPAILNKYRQTWSPMGVIKSAQQWDVSFTWTAELFDTLLGIAPLVFIVTHLKDQNISGTKTGKKVEATKRVLPQKANFRIWLRMNPSGSGAPVGLVLKRIGKAVVNKDGSMSIINVLPRRIEPCTWEKIRWYWDNPVGLREGEKLEKTEIPNDDELNILDGTLSKEQRRSFELMLQYGKKDEEDLEIAASLDLNTAILAYKTSNPNAGPAEIKASVPGAQDLTIPAILKVLGSAQQQ